MHMLSHKIGRHSNRQWMAKFFKCGMRCWYCYKQLSLLPGEDIEIATKDHLTPTSRGGSDQISNIVPACAECNSRKGAMTEAEFRAAFAQAFKTLCAGDVSSEKRLPASVRNDEVLLLQRLEKERAIGYWWRA